MSVRDRIVREASTTGTTYEVEGFFLNEKMKRDLKRAGLKTEDQTWMDVFPNADIVYRFNPDKGKSDVFVGNIGRVRYASGKIRDLNMTPGYFEELDKIQEHVATSHLSPMTFYTVSAMGYTRKEIKRKNEF